MSARPNRTAALARQWARLSESARQHQWQRLTGAEQEELRVALQLISATSARPRWRRSHRWALAGVVGFVVSLSIAAAWSQARFRAESNSPIGNSGAGVAKEPQESSPATGARRRANEKDLRRARDFLSNLPAACADSSISVGDDGTVAIRVRCRKGDEAVDGLVSIKDGIVTEVR